MIQAIIRGITTWINDDTHELPTPTPNDRTLHLINAAYKSQTRIGWDHFLRGRVSKQWDEAHHHHWRESGTGRDLGAHLVDMIWRFSLTIWHSRNASIHGHDDTENKEKQAKRIDEKITIAYNNKDLITDEADTAVLFGKPLPERLQQTLDSKTSWYLLYDSCLNAPIEPTPNDEPTPPPTQTVHAFFRSFPAMLRTETTNR